MSIEHLNWAFRLPMDSASEKAVLIGLANHADPNTGQCWPSIATLCIYTALGARAVQFAIQRLEARGLVSVERRNGRGSRYHLRTTFAGDSASLANDVPDTGEPDSQVPANQIRRTGERRSHEPSRTIKENPQLTLEAAPRRTAAPASRGTRLPADWVLTEEWRAAGAAARAKAGLPAVDLDFEADKFRDYWLARSGTRAAMTDWLATWRNWCRNARPPPTGYVNGHDRQAEMAARDARIDLIAAAEEAKQAARREKPS